MADVNYADPKGMSILHRSVYDGRDCGGEPVLAELLKSKSLRVNQPSRRHPSLFADDPDIGSNDVEMPPIWWAIRRGQVNLAEMLLEHPDIE